jgi:hypothetical protein
MGGGEHGPRERQIRGGAMRRHQKRIGRQRRLILKHAVLWHTDTGKRRAKRAQPADNHRALDRRDDHCRQVAEHHHLANHGDHQEHATEEQAPQATPERTALAPEFNAVAGIVEPDHLLFGMVALADDTEVFHIEFGVGEILDRPLRLLMIGENGDQRVV